MFSLSDMIRTGNSSKCKFGENCTFAYNQLEIDVWTMERNGKLDRNLLFETTATKLDPVNRITRLLQEYQGVFFFLCQVSSASLCNTCNTVTSHYLYYTLYNPVLFGCLCLFRHVLMVNLESSVGVTRMIRPSVLKLATLLMPISASSISVILLVLSLLLWAFVISLLFCAHQVLGVWGEEHQCEQDPPAQHPVPLGFVHTN